MGSKVPRAGDEREMGSTEQGRAGQSRAIYTVSIFCFWVCSLLQETAERVARASWPAPRCCCVLACTPSPHRSAMPHQDGGYALASRPTWSSRNSRADQRAPKRWPSGCARVARGRSSWTERNIPWARGVYCATTYTHTHTFHAHTHTRVFSHPIWSLQIGFRKSIDVLLWCRGAVHGALANTPRRLPSTRRRGGEALRLGEPSRSPGAAVDGGAVWRLASRVDYSQLSAAAVHYCDLCTLL